MDPKAMVTHMYQLGVSFSPVTSVKRSNVDGFDRA